MAKAKTIETDQNVRSFINSFVDKEDKKEESFAMVEYMEKWIGEKARMWGPTIIGFGSYNYKYKSGHEGDAPVIGFSPRKAAFSFYVYSPTDRSNELLQLLGKYKMGKACIYVKKLSDIDIDVLYELCKESVAYINEHHECGCRIK